MVEGIVDGSLSCKGTVNGTCLPNCRFLYVTPGTMQVWVIHQSGRSGTIALGRSTCELGMQMIWYQQIALKLHFDR